MARRRLKRLARHRATRVHAAPENLCAERFDISSDGETAGGGEALQRTFGALRAVGWVLRRSVPPTRTTTSRSRVQWMVELGLLCFAQGVVARRDTPTSRRGLAVLDVKPALPRHGRTVRTAAKGVANTNLAHLETLAAGVACSPLGGHNVDAVRFQRVPASRSQGLIPSLASVGAVLPPSLDGLASAKPKEGVRREAGIVPIDRPTPGEHGVVAL
mmetsp:Transcript_11628/g.19846  ORF Transcript_11628/g.19846 Transcript_11628/m.19846 type:complete len:216 (-) Transcript_11628:209-856(-)